MRDLFESRGWLPEGLLRRALAIDPGLAEPALAKARADCQTISKFENVLPEFEFGSLFAERGAQVTLLRDHANGTCYRSSDLVIDTNGGQVLVEVRRGSSGNPDVGFPRKNRHLGYAASAAFSLWNSGAVVETCPGRSGGARVRGGPRRDGARRSPLHGSAANPDPQADERAGSGEM